MSQEFCVDGVEDMLGKLLVMVHTLDFCFKANSREEEQLMAAGVC